MSNGINFTDFYKFIGSFGENWKNAFDLDKDSIITEYEFYKVVKDKWNGEQTPSADIVDRFFNSFDLNQANENIAGTNRSNMYALDSNEQAALSQSVESYVKLAEVMKNVKNDAFAKALTGDAKTKYLNAIERALTNAIENNQASTLEDLQAVYEDTMVDAFLEAFCKYSDVDFESVREMAANGATPAEIISAANGVYDDYKEASETEFTEMSREKKEKDFKRELQNHKKD